MNLSAFRALMSPMVVFFTLIMTEDVVSSPPCNLVLRLIAFIHGNLAFVMPTFFASMETMSSPSWM
jgi:hypothetical protein